MKIKTENYCVSAKERFCLKDWATKVKPYFSSKDDYEQILREHVEKLSALQELHFASNHKAVVIIFQGMDGAGKDGAIRHVMSGINPEGCDVFSFKKPSHEELEHDFLWREMKHLPGRGRIGIFNRSYYEEVLVVRVHPEHLTSEGLSEAHPKKIWESRYRSIRDIESHLHRNGTEVIKIFLHLSHDEQRRRFLERINDREKNWKLSVADIQERKHWKRYMNAYEECIGATSRNHAPWYIVPADDKENARIIISQILLDRLGSLHMAYPKTTPERYRELKSIRKALQK